MTLRLYNTLTRSKEDFHPRDEGKVSMYVCGPTVYNHIHIGNARTFLSFDVIRRYLRYRGFDVRFVQNVTDVDDKIINRANEEGIPAYQVAEKYTAAFLAAMDALGVEPPDARPLATEEIPGMIALTEKLVETGHAYVVDGDVYFSVRSFPGYGKLSGRDIDDLLSGARVDVDDRKRDPLDFALWKAAKPGEPHWPSPWGEGRPGWHLECAEMSNKELGLSFDIHGGGSDLVFPHHENELAESEAANGVPFARYWLHGGMLQINAEKMSKSLGNFTLLKDALESYPPDVIRLLMLQTHYRSPLDYSTDRLEEAKSALERLRNTVRNLHWARESMTDGRGAPAEARQVLTRTLGGTRDKFEAEMDDDFNTAGALGAVFELARAANAFLAMHEKNLSGTERVILANAEEEIIELLGVLGVRLSAKAQTSYPAEVVPLAASLAGYEGDDPDEAVQALLAARAAARTAKNWAAADAVRDGLAGLGLVIEDTAAGSRLVPKG